MTTQAKVANEQHDTGDSQVDAPILVDLGKKKRKKVKKMRKGRGPLMGVIEDTVTELRSQNQIDENAKPIVIVVREKKKRQKFMRW